jgi:hypothetical protein
MNSACLYLLNGLEFQFLIRKTTLAKLSPKGMKIGWRTITQKLKLERGMTE